MNKIEKLLLAAYILTGVCLLNTQCDKYDDLLPTRVHEFDAKLNIVEAKKTYHINDTLWVELPITDKQLYDYTTNRMLVIDTEAISFSLFIKALYNTPVNPTGGYGDFAVAPAIQSTIFNNESDFGVFVQTQCNAPSLYFKVGFVPKYKGYYAVLTGRNELVSCNNSTNKQTCSEIVYRFNNNDMNRDIYNEIPASERKHFASTYVESGFDGKFTYAFKVE